MLLLSPVRTEPENEMQLYAHYQNPSAKRDGKAAVAITRDIEGRDVKELLVCHGKKEARIIAKNLNAKPWNF